MEKFLTVFRTSYLKDQVYPQNTHIFRKEVRLSVVIVNYEVCSHNAGVLNFSKEQAEQIQLSSVWKVSLLGSPEHDNRGMTIEENLQLFGLRFRNTSMEQFFRFTLKIVSSCL